jgi:hypothetical protein
MAPPNINRQQDMKRAKKTLKYAAFCSKHQSTSNDKRSKKK